MPQKTHTTFHGKPLIGPFSPGTRPVNVGLYPVVSPKSGELCLAYWDGRRFGRYASNADRAMELRDSATKKSLTWYGLANKAA